MEKLRFIDLFCGIGGFRQALGVKGHACVFSSDLDPDARLTYLRISGRNRRATLREFRRLTSPVTICSAGASPVNLSASRGTRRDSRMPAVRSCTKSCGSSATTVRLFFFSRTLRIFSAMPMGVLCRRPSNCLKVSVTKFITPSSMLPATGWLRSERIYFVCFRKDLGVSGFQFPEPTDEDVAVEDVLLPADDPELEELVIERADLFLASEFPAERQNRPLRIGTVGKGGQGERIYSPKGHAITLSAFGGGIGAKTGMYLVDGSRQASAPGGVPQVDGVPRGFPSSSASQRLLQAIREFGSGAGGRQDRLIDRALPRRAIPPGGLSLGFAMPVSALGQEYLLLSSRMRHRRFGSDLSFPKISFRSVFQKDFQVIIPISSSWTMWSGSRRWFRES